MGLWKQRTGDEPERPEPAQDAPTPAPRAAAPALARVRDRGGNILVAELPPPNDPAAFHPDVEDLVTRVLGPGALQERQ